MEWKKKFLELKEKNVRVRLTFKFPQFNSFTFKRGVVLDAHDEFFDFNEVEEGVSTLSYAYITEVKELKAS